jgi:hypothetical protein
LKQKARLAVNLAVACIGDDLLLRILRSTDSQRDRRSGAHHPLLPRIQVLGYHER